MLRALAALGALLTRAAHDLLGLVVPVACAGCTRPDVAWCPTCDAALQGAPRRCDGDAGRLDLLDGRSLLDVRCVARYAGPVRSAVTAWKDRGRTDLDRPFAAVLRRAARRTTGAGPAGRAAAGATSAVLVVPVPSTGRARRQRGRAPVEVLAAAVAAGLRDAGVPASVSHALRRVAGPDLARLGARARGVALAGSVHVSRRTDLRGREVVLVDDVLTTGATLAACHAALVAAGAHVRGGWVLAATPPPPGRAVAPAVTGIVRPAQRAVRDPGPRG